MKREISTLARKFRDSEPWNFLSDGDIFAVQLSCGEIGYCCVMGNGGEHYGLSLYIGDKGWYSYLNLCSVGHKFDWTEISQKAFRLDCINCDIIDGKPKLERHIPYMYPIEPKDPGDLKAITEGLKATVYMAGLLEKLPWEQIGFTDEGIELSDETRQNIPFLIPSGDSFRLSKITLPSYTAEELPSPAFDDETMITKIMPLNADRSS